MKQPLDLERRFISSLSNVLLAMVGLGISLILMEWSVRTFPSIVPGDVRVDPPVRRIEAFSDQIYDVKLSNGDLYYWMPGAIAPVPHDQDKVLARVHFTTDENGFRNDLPALESYEIVALGDSFTVAGNVASPWPEMLAEYSEKTVLNLGEAGNAPQQELRSLRRYGIDVSPSWVILAYFEGNDLYDAASYEQASPFILPRFGKYIVERGLESISKNRSNNTSERIGAGYHYPITATINDHKLEMAFFSYYISWLSADRQVMESSQNFHLVTDAVLQARELSEGAEARFLLVYVPSKEHVYLPYLNDVDLKTRVVTNVPMIELNEAKFLQFTEKQATPEIISQHMNDQSDLFADFAVEQNIDYLDLTPAFQEEAETGAELYYPFDTHWNQDGHDLAARTIAKYIQEILTAHLPIP